MRAHVLALGGNALISYFMSELVIMHNPHKNQVSLMDFLCLLTLRFFSSSYWVRRFSLACCRSWKGILVIFHFEKFTPKSACSITFECFFSNNDYRITSYSFRRNYSFLDLEIQRSQYIRPNVTKHKCAENIQGRKLHEEIRYLELYIKLQEICAF